MYRLSEGLQDMQTMSEYVASHSLQEILEECKKEKGTAPDAEEAYLNLVDLKENLEKYRWLYVRLADAKSCLVLTAVCRYRLCGEASLIRELAEPRRVGHENDYADAGRSHGVLEACQSGQIIGLCHENADFSVRLGVVQDLWELPELISSIRRDYRISLRCYRTDCAFELVLSAAPPVRRSRQKKQGICVWPIPGEVCWQNEQLMKDCIVIPYLYYKNYGSRIKVPSKKTGEYPYLDRMPGLTMDFPAFPGLRDAPGDVRVLCDYIRGHAADMDVVFLYSAYHWFIEPLEVYRSLRPDGRVVLKLDLNSGWMDFLPVDTVQFRRFLSQTDMIAVESHYLQKLLAKKWPGKSSI